MDPTTVEETKERKFIKIDKGQVREHLGYSRAWKRLSVDLLDAEADRLYARPAATSAVRIGWTPGQGITSASCTPKPARYAM